MKKFVFTGVLCFLVSFSFGQKKVVSAAKNELKNNPPNFTEARNLIKEALKNPETANDAETWYIAGQIENKQFDTERTLQILGKEPNEEVMYSALEQIIPYFKKAVSFDTLPNEKGKVKPRFLKDICANIRANRPFYINAGLFAYEKKNYQKAHENFKLYGDIRSLDILKGEKWEIAENDTSELQIRYYAGIAASLIPDNQAAIAIYNELKNKPYISNEIYKETDVYQNLANEYRQLNDSSAFENLIKEGFKKFPSNEFFVFNMIDLSIKTGEFKEAVSYLEKVIAQEPDNPRLYFVMGQVYDQDNKPDEAIKYLRKATEMEPNNVDFLFYLGRAYFNLGVEKRTLSDNETSNIAKSKEIAKQSQDYFKESMPFFEKVLKLDSKNKDAISALRSIYYNLGMGAEYEKMDALINTIGD